MAMDRQVSQAIESVLGASIEHVRGLSGGDINDAYLLTMQDGTRLFAKTHPRAPRTMFPAEARGLAWLAEADALRVPSVVAVSDEHSAANFLVLEYLEPASRVKDFDEQLGVGLAALHRFGAPSVGLDHENFIGSLPQSNGNHATWAEFYRSERLVPQVERAARSGLIDRGLRSKMERLLERLEELIGPDEAPQRLHGELWGGNLHVDPQGRPALIDPAAYAGHREVDLAMMRLFGGFSARVFAAYEAAYPVQDDARERVPLYQLYPLLVHVNLFGHGYVGSVASVVDSYL
jgi:fructosamine-3-kinase